MATANLSVITCSPEIMSGTPVFAGTRVPIKNLWDYLEGGNSLEEFLKDFPTVPRAQAIEVLEMAHRRLLEEGPTPDRSEP
jgi:uncharacterized protein (DUF433 family)